MSVNIKTTDGLQKIASNVSIAQADWNQRENTTKNTRILNQPETLTSMEEINANTNENALAGAMAVKEGIDTLTNSLNQIGAIKTVPLTATTVPNNTYTSLTSITLDEGAYVLLGHVRFTANNTGRRGMSVHGTSGWSSVHALNNAIEDAPTVLHYSTIVYVGKDTQTTMYLNAFQNSGVELTCDAGYLQAIKISS